MSAPRSNKIPIDAIEQIVGYLYSDEARDAGYTAIGDKIPRRHIFRSVLTVNDWLHERRHAERWKRCDIEA